MSAGQATNTANESAREQRAAFRENKNLLIGTIVLDNETVALDCTISNLSETGARVMLPNPHILPDQIVLLEPRKFVAHEASVMWRRGVLAGLSFDYTFALEDGLTPRDQALRTFAVETATRCGF